MYYMLYPSSDPGVIGNVALQVVEAEFPGPVDHPYLTRNVFLKYIPEELAVTPTVVLAKEAKLTDLIHGATGGHTWQLIVSDKMKQILQRQNNRGIQFLTSTVIYNKVELANYWLINPFDYDMEAVNFEKSKIFLEGLGGTPIKEVHFKNYLEFEKQRKSLELPLRLNIKELVMKASVSDSLVLIKWIGQAGGLCYCVSEQLKMVIEDAGCTGIEFIPIKAA